jgi:CelD/BcsL family acetyltransferase involved in cellulose biosynthesis
VRHGCKAIECPDFRVCDYSAPLVAPAVEFTAEEMHRIWTAVREILPPADILLLSRIPDRLGTMANPLALLPKWRRMDLQTFGLTIDGDPDTLLKRVCTPSMAREVAANARRLHRCGAVRFVLANTADEVREIFAALVDQRLKRFREVGRFDLLTRPGVPEFYLDVALRSVASGGPVRLFGVSVDGEWIACAYGLVGGGAFLGILLSMAGEAWRKYSPGLHIAGETMRWARSQGLTYFDMNIGPMPYKNGFSATGCDLYEVAEPLTARGALLLHAIQAKAGARAWLRRHPKLFVQLRGLLQGLRRINRRIRGGDPEPGFLKQARGAGINSPKHEAHQDR